MIVEEKIEEALQELRAFIQNDGGDIDFVSYEKETHTAFVDLTGQCVGCPASTMTLKFGVERMLRERVPEVEFVELV